MNNYPSLTTCATPMHILLRQRREQLNLRQADIAEALHVTAEAITLWESGKRRMELGKIPRIAEALQIDPRELCTRALEQFHPSFFQTLFGPRPGTPATIPPLA